MTESTAKPRLNFTAVLALILGLLVSPIALAVGWFAREQIKRSGERGNGIAIAAIVLGSVAIPFWIVIAVTAFQWWLSL